MDPDDQVFSDNEEPDDMGLSDDEDNEVQDQPAPEGMEFPTDVEDQESKLEGSQSEMKENDEVVSNTKNNNDGKSSAEKEKNIQWSASTKNNNGKLLMNENDNGPDGMDGPVGVVWVQLLVIMVSPIIKSLIEWRVVILG